MIKIHRDQHHITVPGHAPRSDGAPPGQNIVCAAVSALTLTLIEGLETVAGMDIRAEVDPGNVRIDWTEESDTGKALINTWYLGIKRIRDSYNNTISIV